MSNRAAFILNMRDAAFDIALLPEAFKNAEFFEETIQNCTQFVRIYAVYGQYIGERTIVRLVETCEFILVKRVMMTLSAVAKTYQVCIAACRRNGHMLKYVPLKQMNDELILAAFNQDISSIRELDCCFYTPEMLARVFREIRLTAENRYWYSCILVNAAKTLPITVRFLEIIIPHCFNELFFNYFFDRVTLPSDEVYERLTNMNLHDYAVNRVVNMEECSVELMTAKNTLEMYGECTYHKKLNTLNGVKSGICIGVCTTRTKRGAKIRGFVTPMVTDFFENRIENDWSVTSIKSNRQLKYAAVAPRREMRFEREAGAPAYVYPPIRRLVPHAHFEIPDVFAVQGGRGGHRAGAAAAAAAAPAAPRNYKDDKEMSDKRKMEEIIKLYKGKEYKETKDLKFKGEIVEMEGVCCICTCEFDHKETVVKCGCDKAHTYCTNCFEFMVRIQCDTKNVETFKPAEWEARQGRVMCDNDESVAFPNTVVTKFENVVECYFSSVTEYTANVTRKQTTCGSAAAEIVEKALEAFVTGKAVSNKMAVEWIRDYILTQRCPDCLAPFSDYTNCSAVHCDCGANFCGLCMGFSSKNSLETHAHVIGCNLNPQKGTSYAFISPEVKVKIAEHTGRNIVKYIEGLTLSTNDKLEICTEISKDANDCGIPEYILNNYIESIFVTVVD